MPETYFEDIVVGATGTYGSYTVDREEMLAFARRYDPQPVHVNEEAARDSPYDGLIASGWLTTAVWARLFVTGFLDDKGADMQGALGMDNLRWEKPVRAGDTLSVSVEVLEKEPFNETLGMVRMGTTVVNQDGETVLTMEGLGLFERRNAED